LIAFTSQSSDNAARRLLLQIMAILVSSTSSPADATMILVSLMVHPVEQLCFIPWKRRANIDMSDFPGLLIAISAPRLAKIQGKYTPLRATAAERKWKGGSFGVAASRLIVLQTMIEKSKPLLDTFPWFSQSQSPFTDNIARRRANFRSRCFSPARTTMIRAVLKLTSSGSPVLEAIVENNELSSGESIGAINWVKNSNKVVALVEVNRPRTDHRRARKAF